MCKIFPDCPQGWATPMVRIRMLSVALLFPCLLLPQGLGVAEQTVPIGIQWQTMMLQQEKVLRELAGPYLGAIESAAQKTGLSPLLLAAVLHVESRGQAQAVSAVGAIGPMQLMPVTALRVLHVNPWRVQQNILGGATFLQDLIRKFHGNLTLALEAYNAGPTRIAAGRPAPPQAVAYACEVEYWLHGPMPPQEKHGPFPAKRVFPQ